MQSQTVFFTGTIDPDTGEIRSRRIDTQRNLPDHDLLVDVHYSDGVRNAVDETADEFYRAYQAARSVMAEQPIFVSFPMASDPANTDPTLAQFYEPKQGRGSDEKHA